MGSGQVRAIGIASRRKGRRSTGRSRRRGRGPAGAAGFGAACAALLLRGAVTRNPRLQQAPREGGVGSVFDGSLVSGTRIAVKKLLEAGAAEASHREQMATEVGMLTLVQHANIVPLLGWCEGAAPCLVYALMEGTPSWLCPPNIKS